MKKYFLTPIPALLGFLNSLALRATDSNPDNLIRTTPREVNSLANTSVNVRVIISVTFLAILIIYDITAWFGRRAKRREFERFTGLTRDDTK